MDIDVEKIMRKDVRALDDDMVDRMRMRREYDGKSRCAPDEFSYGEVSRLQRHCIMFGRCNKGGNSLY